jgi:hypothetical protein
MITSTLVSSASLANPVRVFKSTVTGEIGGTNQERAITTIIMCNKESPNITDETVNSVVVNVHLVKNGQVFSTSNIIISNLIIPAGETVFFAEERVVLDGGDEIWIGTDNTNRLAVTVSSIPV